MTNTTAETLTVDGVNLKTLAKNIETLAATLRAPGKRGANAIVASRDGSIYTPWKPSEDGVIVLPMWIAGCDDDGNIPGGSTARKEFYKNLDRLTALFEKDYGLLDVRHTLPDGSVRQALCDCVSSIDFTTSGTNPIGKFSVELVNPEAYWRSVLQVVTESAIIGTGWTWATGGTAPVNDATYEVWGPITNARITDVTSGAWVQYTGTIANGDKLTLNADTFVVSGTGFNPNMGGIGYWKTGNRLMRMTPSRTLHAYNVRLTGTSTGAATKLKVTGYQKYKVG